MFAAVFGGLVFMFYVILFGPIFSRLCIDMLIGELLPSPAKLLPIILCATQRTPQSKAVIFCPC
jgi:hypothetical protein